MRLTYE